METNTSVKLQTVTLKEYHKKADEFFAARDAEGFLEFQRTHSIIYNDPIPKEDKALLERLEVSELPEDTDLEEAQ